MNNVKGIKTYEAHKEIPKAIADFTTSLLPEEFLKLILEYNNKFVNK